MRHPYIGDVGDFGKYGLLRVLAGDGHGLRLGVVWYLTDSAEHNNDGKHDGYLKSASEKVREAFRCCDPPLYSQMASIRARQQLNVEMVQDGSILPKDTVFYGDPVPAFEGRAATRTSVLTRWEQRDVWHSRALQKTANSRCVFVDPDNGIILTSREEAGRRRPSHKHAYWHEIAGYLDRGQSVVAYHHLGRQRGGHLAHIHHCLAAIQTFGYTAWAVHYRRGTARAFFIIPTSEHRRRLLEGARRYIGTWGRHAALIAD